MTFRRRDVVRDHVKPLIQLKVADHQKAFVAPNEVTLAQHAYEKGAYVWGLWDDEVLVGLIAMIHPAESDDMDIGDDPGAAYIWRLMIGEIYQGRGYGEKAIAIARSIARDWGLPRISLSFCDERGGPGEFYHKQGFRLTGRIRGEETEMARDA